MEENKGNGRQLSAGIVSGVAILIICAIALFLRVKLPQASVFRDGVAYFKENDPWYHVRLVENLMRHFPFRISFDPYTYFPYGQSVWFAPLFDLLLGFAIWVISLGKPTPEIIQTVSLYFPAVLGMLVVPPVYFIGKELFDRKAGLIAAALVAIMPSTFLARSLLGFTDHHVAETLFSTLTMLFLIMALKRGTAAGITFADIRNRDWKRIRKTLIYALLAGASLGFYLLVWSGGLLLLFILFTAVVLIYLIDYMRRKSTDYLVIISVTVFLTALIMIIPLLSQLPFGDLCVVSLAVGVLTLPALNLVSWFTERRGLARVYYPFILLTLGIAGAGGLFAVDRPLFLEILDKFRVFTPEMGALTISEARPLLYARGGFSLNTPRDEFTAGIIMAPLASLLILWSAIRKTSPEKWFFIVWCAVMTAATLGQIRFTYYLTVNISLLSGYLLWQTGSLIYRGVDWILIQNYRRQQQKLALIERRNRRAAKGKRQTTQEKVEPDTGFKRPLWVKLVSNIVIEVIVFFLVLFPNYQPALAVATSFSGPNEDWRDALVWLKTNTPEPFGDPDFYYNYYEKPANGENYKYPPSAYGIMSWWDYGHWITEIGHRIPNANPHQAGAVSAGEFFIAQDEEAAKKILDKLGSKYVIIDLEMAVPYRMAENEIQYGKFYAMAIWAGDTPDRYFEIYLKKKENNTWEQVPLYYPEYYQSMSTRLYNFKGQEARPNSSTTIISFGERSGRKEILTEQTFGTYEEAQDFLSKQSGNNWRIVGKDAFRSPVPLKKLEHFQLLYHSGSWAAKIGENVIAYLVEIFSYTP